MPKGRVEQHRRLKRRRAVNRLCWFQGIVVVAGYVFSLAKSNICDYSQRL
ncbi:MAG: hypothetical protein QNJ63_22560 [Calothrix sp. MO_192.B10]|nr:hypothetical protein [Calothrix sp. MO_192.B10]